MYNLLTSYPRGGLSCCLATVFHVTCYVTRREKRIVYSKDHPLRADIHSHCAELLASSTFPDIMNLNSKFMSHDYIPLNIASSYHDYERDGTDISVVGSLRKHYDHWVENRAPPFVLDIIKHGYTIPFRSTSEYPRKRGRFFKYWIYIFNVCLAII